MSIGGPHEVLPPHGYRVGEDGTAAVHADEYVQHALEILLLLLEEVDDQLLLSDLKEPGERGECSIVVRQAELLEVSPRVRRVVHDRAGREAQRRAGSGSPTR